MPSCMLPDFSSAHPALPLVLLFVEPIDLLAFTCKASRRRKIRIERDLRRKISGLDHLSSVMTIGSPALAVKRKVPCSSATKCCFVEREYLRPAMSPATVNVRLPVPGA